MAVLCLAIEQTADSSWLSGKGMGYCMLLGLCLNANRNAEEEAEEEENESEPDTEIATNQDDDQLADKN